MKDLALAILLSYIAGGFLTNAYCQTHRLEDWQASHRTEKRSWDGSIDIDSDGAKEAKQDLTVATLLWPGYWASRISLWIVSHEFRLHPPPRMPMDYELPLLTHPIGG